MSSTRRIIPISLDQEAAARRVVVGAALRAPDATQAITLYYGAQCLFQCTIYSGSPASQFQPDPAATWLWGIDSTPIPDHPDLVLSQNDQFNIPGDWADLDLLTGKISWRADLATVELKDALAAYAANILSVAMFANLWMLTADGNVLIASWPVTIGRVHVDPVTAVPVESVTHLTTQAAASSYVPVWGDQARWRWKNGGWQYLFEEDSKWRSMAPKIVDEQPAIAWGDPED